MPTSPLAPPRGCGKIARFRGRQESGQPPVREHERPGGRNTYAARPAIGLLHELDHFRERCAREENPIHTFLLHAANVSGCDRAASPAKDPDIARALAL